ncbi:MAG TPA: hypothetical protein VG796_08655 [Verrucomicrobiales bacterium]|nr:hypothetical protein [Verrucomicrobiales bacterium]
MNPVTRSLILAFALTAPGQLEAASVYINSSLVTATGTGTTQAQMKLRAGRNAQWDAALANRVGFGANNALRTDLTSNFSAGQIYQFSVENRPGEGIVYTVTPAGGAASTVAWGNFSTPVNGTVVTTLNGRTVPADFNTISFETLATLAGSTASVSGLVFSSPDLNVADGAWQNVVMTPTTPGNAGMGTSQQTLFSDINMAAVPWTLSGIASLHRPNSAGAAENIRTFVQLRQTPIAIVQAAVPEPKSSATALLAASLLLGRRRRS